MVTWTPSREKTTYLDDIGSDRPRLLKVDGTSLDLRVNLKAIGTTIEEIPGHTLGRKEPGHLFLDPVLIGTRPLKDDREPNAWNQNRQVRHQPLKLAPQLLKEYPVFFNLLTSFITSVPVNTYIEGATPRTWERNHHDRVRRSDHQSFDAFEAILRREVILLGNIVDSASVREGIKLLKV